MVEKLDHSQIKGMENIGSDFLDQLFDPGNQYSVPYFWGTLGIVYNSKMVDKAPEHWDDLFMPEYKNSIMLIDGARGYGLGLNSLGYGLNDKMRIICRKLWTSSGKLHQISKLL